MKLPERNISPPSYIKISKILHPAFRQKSYTYIQKEEVNFKKTVSMRTTVVGPSVFKIELFLVLKIVFSLERKCKYFAEKP